MTCAQGLLRLLWGGPEVGVLRDCMHAIIKERNHQAEYIPCVAHSLNLVGKCAAECCQSAVRFFMFVQGLYVFFSASTHRWNLLTDALKPLKCPTIKPFV